MTSKSLHNLLTVVLLLLVGYFLFIKQDKPVETITVKTTTIDTLIITDTLTFTDIKYVDKEVVRVDTLFVRDSIPVYIPISEYRYKTDDYDILTEGYNVKLKEISVYPKIKYINIDRIIEKPPPRVSHGVNLGIGFMYGTKGLDVGFYGGYGVNIIF